MKDFLLAMPSDMLAGSFGVTAALLLVGGSIALRLQRQSQRYALMRAAIEKGITRLPGGAPFWLVSMRQGVIALALGLGLLIVGGVGAGMASRVPYPPASTQPTQSREMRPEPPPPRMDDDGPDRIRPFGQGPLGQGPPGQGPDRRRGDAGREQEPPRPPMPDLPTQQWHFAQMQMAVSLGAIACGVILLLVGAARVVFAGVEKTGHEKNMSEDAI